MKKEVDGAHFKTSRIALEDVIEGRMEGKRPRGRHRMKMVDNIRGRHSYQELKERAQNDKHSETT